MYAQFLMLTLKKLWAVRFKIGRKQIKDKAGSEFKRTEQLSRNRQKKRERKGWGGNSSSG